MTPGIGDIWQYTFIKNHHVITVLVLEENDEWQDTWFCLSLDNGECGEWYFGEQAMKDWRKLA
jgi:hypothetical protein